MRVPGVEEATAQPGSRGGGAEGAGPGSPGPSAVPSAAAGGGEPVPGSRAEEDLALARVAMERGLVTADEVREILGIQADFTAIGRAVPIGQLLIRRRLLDVETFVELAREVRRRAVRCPACRGLSLLPRPEAVPPEAEHGRCARCGALLPLRATVPAEPGADGGSAAGAAPPAETLPAAAGEPAPAGEEPGRDGAALDAQPPPAAAGVPAPAEAAGRPRRRRHEPLTGRRFGHTEVLEEIARGGMGVVYRARDHERLRIVALKVLKDGVHATEKQVRRFLREIDTVKKLRHPNIVEIYDVGCVQGQHFFTMELVDGQALDELLRRGPLPVRRAMELCEQVARAIHHAHEHGVIHRDLKPANILLDRRGVPRITDFGLAKNIDHTSAMTRTGAAVGTPYYMPPEQAKGDSSRIDRRVDVYALGVILFEMITGELPFDGETNIEVYRKIMEEQPPAPSSIDPRIDSDVDRVVLKAMAKEREDRYPSALALADDIRRWLDGQPVLARRPSRVRQMVRRARRVAPVAGAALAAVLFVLAVLGAVLVIDERSARRERQAQARAELESRQGRLATVGADAASTLRRVRVLLGERRAAEAQALAEEALAVLGGLERWPEQLSYPELNREQVRALIERFEREQGRELVRELQLVRAEALALLGTPQSDEQALAALRQAEQVAPQDPAVHVLRGRLHAARGRLGAAETSFARALAFAPGHLEALLGRGRVLERLGRFVDALEDYRRVMELERERSAASGPARFRPIGSEEPTPLARAMLRAALCEAALGRPAEARRLLDELIDGDPGHFPAYVARSELRLAGDLLGAQADARAAIDLKRGRPEGHVALGRVLLVRGRPDEAAAALQTALATDRTHAPAALYLGLALERQGELRAALDAYAKACEPRLDGAYLEERAVAWLRRGELKRIAGEPEAAVLAYEQALALLPRLGAAELGRVRLELARGELERARAALERARALVVEPLALETTRGWVALGAGEPAAAVRAFEQALGQAGSGLALEAAAGLAAALEAAGQQAAARTAYARVLGMERRLLGEESLVSLLGGPEAAGRLLGDAAAGAARPELEAVLAVRGALALVPFGTEASAAPEQAALARSLLEAAAARLPVLALAQLVLARLREAREGAAAALGAAAAAVQANPYFVDGLVLLGRLRWEVANAAAGGASSSAAPGGGAAGPGPAGPGSTGGGAARPHESLQAAREPLERAVALAPARVAPWYWRARVRLSAGDEDGALDDLERAVAAGEQRSGEGSGGAHRG